MSDYIVAIDLGTTKVVSIVGQKTPTGYFKILAFKEKQSEGVRYGQVENILKVVKVVKPTLDHIKKSLNIEVNEVFVGIAGQNVKYIRNSIERQRDKSDCEILPDEVKQLEEDIRKMPLEPGEEILHAIPQYYSIDDEINITDPIGRLGNSLIGHFHIVIGKTKTLLHTKICIDRLNLTLKSLILEPIASAKAILSDEEKEQGVAVVDMGGGTTDVIVYINGIEQHVAVIPFGGNIITSDIQQAFDILLPQAEKMKIQCGSCIESEVSDKIRISVPGVSGREPKIISAKLLAAIIESRMCEIIDILINEIKPFRHKLKAGIVFTGGASKMTDLQKYVTLKTGLAVQLGEPKRVTTDSPVEIIHPKYSTVVGLLMYAAEVADSAEDMFEILVAAPEIIEKKQNIGSNPKVETVKKVDKKLSEGLSKPINAVIDFFTEKEEEQDI